MLQEIYIKIMNYLEKKDEKIRDIFVKDTVKDKLNVKVDPSEIQAIYRIRGNIGEARPVIMKLVNSEVKYRIMRAKENLPKKENVRLVEDFTKDNVGLITRLRNCKEFESAWYFNCSVYGKLLMKREYHLIYLMTSTTKLLKDTRLTICSGFICTIKEYSELLFNKQ
jgi:hypothetical protein